MLVSSCYIHDRQASPFSSSLIQISFSPVSAKGSTSIFRRVVIICSEPFCSAKCKRFHLRVSQKLTISSLGSIPTNSLQVDRFFFHIEYVIGAQESISVLHRCIAAFLKLRFRMSAPVPYAAARCPIVHPTTSSLLQAVNHLRAHMPKNSAVVVSFSQGRSGSHSKGIDVQVRAFS